MKILVLFGQRVEAYPGEYAPEALACIAEIHHQDNPEYLEDEHKRLVASGEFRSVVVVAIEIDAGALQSLLSPPAPVLPGRIVVAGDAA